MAKEKQAQPTIIISIDEVSRQTSLGKSCIYDMLRAGVFPKPRQLTPGRVGWIRSEIVEWVNNRPVAD